MSFGNPFPAWYGLNADHTLVRLPGPLEAECWLGKDVVHVGQLFYCYRANETNEFVNVSTVFLSLDHGFSEDGPPIVFETMIFGPVDTDYQERYCTWEEAERGHARACERVTCYLLQEGYNFVTSSKAPQEYLDRTRAERDASYQRLKGFLEEWEREKGKAP